MAPETNKGQEAVNPLEHYIQERSRWIGDAVEIVTGQRGLDPTVVFQAPGEVRAKDEGLTLTEQQEADIRAVASRFGLGAEQDIATEAEVQVNEGGKPWKIEAEAAITGSAHTIIFAGSPFRKLGADESGYLEAKYGQAAETEFDMVRQVAIAQDGFVALEQDEVLPFGYDIQNGHSLVQAATGQLVKIGTVNGKDVVLLRVDRENYTDEEGKSKYRKQPDTAAVLGFVSNVLAACGDESSAVGFNTSNTYPSRAVDMVRAGLKAGRNFVVGMYGRNTILSLDPPTVPAQTAINQIPGELREIYGKLQLLAEELRAEQ